MSKSPKKNSGRSLARPAKPKSPSPTDFDFVLGLIEAARTRAVAAVNTTLIELYWSIGEHITQKVSRDGWGKGTVEVLAATIQRRFPGLTGYSAQNLWRMRQFFETYRDQPILSPLVRELSWTSRGSGWHQGLAASISTTAGCKAQTNRREKITEEETPPLKRTPMTEPS